MKISHSSGSSLSLAPVTGHGFTTINPCCVSLDGSRDEAGHGFLFHHCHLLISNGAILVGSQLDGAVLDNANLQNAVLQDASLQSFQGRSASLQGIKAQGASFVRANLSGADLTRAQMEARAYLFTLSGSSSVQQLVTELDQKAYPQLDLIQAFTSHGVTLSTASPVKVLLKGQCWQIQDPNGPYVLLLNTTGNLDVSSASTDLRPAVLRQAICLGTKAP